MKESAPKEDIQSLLLGIKGDISDVNIQINDLKQQQVTSIDKFCNLLDSKLNDVKHTVGLDLSGIKDKVGHNESLLDKMQATQNQLNEKVSTLEGFKHKASTNSKSLSEMSVEFESMSNNVEILNGKMVSMQDKSCDIELSVIKQNRAHEQINWEMSGHIQDVEYGLASHIETVKGNMEKELVGAKQNQILLENKLSCFTQELDQQNSNLNKRMQELRTDFEQLKTIYSNSFENSASFANPVSTSSSFSNPSSLSGYPSTPPSRLSIYPNISQSTQSAQNSCDPGPDHINWDNNNPDAFYMYGDTSKTLIVDGVVEARHENLGEIMFQCINEIGIPLKPTDIEEVARIGKFNHGKKWPRPVKVTFRNQTTRDQVLIFKSRLRFSETFSELRINIEQRKDLRVKAAKLRQAGLTARKMGYKVDIKPGQVKINGINYSTETLDSIPQIFMKDANQVRDKHENSAHNPPSQKCRTESSKVIMVGTSLQKKTFGLAFYSISCFLSNFYPCEIYFRNQLFTSLEQGYQCTKADICKDSLAFQAILNAETPSLAKSIGGEIQTNSLWEEIKLQVMEDLVFAKFKQNRKLYYSLMNTRPLYLIEATLDGFWGANCILGSIALDEGCWTGSNHLGKILMKIREHFAKELEKAQKAVL